MFILIPSHAHAQGGNAVLIRFVGVPTGSCSPVGLAVNNATGDFYDCLAASWHAVGGGGGGSLSGTLTSGKVPHATGANTLADGSITDDGTGNAVAITGTQAQLFLNSTGVHTASTTYELNGVSEFSAYMFSTGSTYAIQDNVTGLQALQLSRAGGVDNAYFPAQLTVGTNGVAQGSLILNGATSGSCTKTVDATSTLVTEGCGLFAPSIIAGDQNTPNDPSDLLSLHLTKNVTPDTYFEFFSRNYT